MGVSRTMWLRGLRSDYAKIKKNILLERDTRTVEISSIWQKGYTALKDENDRMEMERDRKFRQDMKENDDWFKEQVAKGPPED